MLLKLHGLHVAGPAPIVRLVADAAVFGQVDRLAVLIEQICLEMLGVIEPDLVILPKRALRRAAAVPESVAVP